MGLFIAIAFFPVSVYAGMAAVFIITFSHIRATQNSGESWYRAFIKERELSKSICSKCRFGHLMCFDKQEAVHDWETKIKCRSYKK
jgi:hypothetical protein